MLFCMWTVWIPWVEVVHLILGHWIRATDEFVELYKQKTGHSIVEPAHMVLDELKLLFSKTEPPFTSLVKIALSSWDVSYSDPINPLQVHLYCGIVTSRLTKKLCSPYFLHKSCVSVQELADPSIANAFDRCVEQGATRVIISPYFLFPGRHWNKVTPLPPLQFLLHWDSWLF